jgi:hypothetical protein
MLQSSKPNWPSTASSKSYARSPRGHTGAIVDAADRVETPAEVIDSDSIPRAV